MSFNLPAAFGTNCGLRACKAERQRLKNPIGVKLARQQLIHRLSQCALGLTAHAVLPGEKSGAETGTDDIKWCAVCVQHPHLHPPEGIRPCTVRTDRHRRTLQAAKRCRASPRSSTSSIGMSVAAPTAANMTQPQGRTPQMQCHAPFLPLSNLGCSPFSDMPQLQAGVANRVTLLLAKCVITQ